MKNLIALAIGCACLAGGIMLIAHASGWWIILGAALVGFSYGWAWTWRE